MLRVGSTRDIKIFCSGFLNHSVGFPPLLYDSCPPSLCSGCLAVLLSKVKLFPHVWIEHFWHPVLAGGGSILRIENTCTHILSLWQLPDWVIRAGSRMGEENCSQQGKLAKLGRQAAENRLHPGVWQSQQLAQRDIISVSNRDMMWAWDPRSSSGALGKGFCDTRL